MDDDTIEPFGFPAIGRKKLTAAFDGGRLTSDGGVLLLAAAERHLGICDQLAALIADLRDPARVVRGGRTHAFDLYVSVEEIWRRTGLPAAALERLAEADAFRGLGLDRRQA